MPGLTANTVDAPYKIDKSFNFLILHNQTVSGSLTHSFQDICNYLQSVYLYDNANDLIEFV